MADSTDFASWQNRTDLLLAALFPGLATGTVYWVATDGSDTTGDGSQADPWATITHALDNVPDESLILVAPGTYSGRIRIRGTFPIGVTVRSELPYRALLPANREHLLMAGRCISGSSVAHASYRVTGDCVAMGQAAGAGEAAVPLRYRKRVGQYFRRVADELSE